jgi:uncharacterized protein (TIGR02118 family)
MRTLWWGDVAAASPTDRHGLRKAATQERDFTLGMDYCWAAAASGRGETMITVSVMYPATEGSKFDMDYYLKTHVPLAGARWGSFGLRDAKVLRGTGAPGGAAPSYSVIALLTFESAADFQRAVAAHGKEVMGDIPNFTNVQPVVQINEIAA